MNQHKSSKINKKNLYLLEMKKIKNKTMKIRL